MTQGDGMGREEGSGWGTHVYLWWIHFDIWQNQYNIVKFKKKKKDSKSFLSKNSLNKTFRITAETMKVGYQDNSQELLRSTEKSVGLNGPLLCSKH